MAESTGVTPVEIIMNKKQIQRIKKIIGFNPELPEHKRLLRRLKKQYIKLPKDKKVDLIGDLKKAFEEEA